MILPPPDNPRSCPYPYPSKTTLLTLSLQKKSRHLKIIYKTKIWIKQTNKQKNDKRAKGKAYEHINTEMLSHAQKFHKDKIKSCDIKVKMPVCGGGWGNCPRKSIMRKKNLQKYQWLTFCWAWGDLALGVVYSPSKTPLKKCFFFTISNSYHLEVASGLGGMDVISKRQLTQSTSKRRNILITKTRRQKLFIILLTFLSDNSLEETHDVTIHFLYSWDKKMQEEGKWIIK